MIPKRYISLINLSLLTILIALVIYLVWDNYRNWYSPRKEVLSHRQEASARPLSTPAPSEYEVIISRNLWKEKFAAPVDLPPPHAQASPRPSAQTAVDRDLDKYR